MGKVASIDIGTNSMRLLIAEKSEYLENRKKYVDITRLGRGVDQNGYIDADTMERNLRVLHRFVTMAKKEKVEHIEVIGTSALRDSKNRQEFLDKAREQTGVNVRIIEGVEEAMLGFYGAVTGLKKSGYVLLLDIGGGSTEFILGSYEEGILFSESIDVGALRMTEKFITKDKPSAEEIKSIQEYVLEKMSLVIATLKSYPFVELIGIGGTITTFSAMIQNLEVYDTERVHNSKLMLCEIEEKVKLLASKTLEERMMINGLQPKRADIIVAGGIILETVMKILNKEEITVSEYDNLEGILYQNGHKN